MNKKPFVSLDDILGRDVAELTKLKESEFFVEKMGAEIPFTEITQPEYKRAKKDCFKIKNGSRKGQPEMEFDDDKLKVKLIIEAVGKDTRSTFTFADKRLLEHLGVVTAEQAVDKLVSPGEIHNWAMEIQDLSGFSEAAQEETAEEIKNL